MRDGRALGLATLVAASALAGGVWLALGGDAPLEESSDERATVRLTDTSPAPPSPQPMPAPFGDRVVRVPDPREPAPSQTAAFCADENWSRMDALVSPGEVGEFRVDPAAWSGSLTGTRAGIASWISQCKGGGEAVRIVAADSGALLATYDTRSGLDASER